MSAGSPPKRVRQSPSLSTTALGAGASSVGRNVRPATGVTPSTSKKRRRHELALDALDPCRREPLEQRTAAKIRARSPQCASNDAAPLLPITQVDADPPACVRPLGSAPRPSPAVRARGRAAGAASSRRRARTSRCWRRCRAPASATATSVKPGEPFIWRIANLTSLPNSSSRCVMRISRSLFLPMSTHVRFSRVTSPSWRMASSRAVFGSIPCAMSSRVRISTWKAISSSTSCSSGTRHSHERSRRLIGPAGSWRRRWRTGATWRIRQPGARGRQG